ncbi:hypothetical protein [Lysinibacillus parviboronicapiens]|uniref:hypothetical protein n=1 Tax=Lysinibacillus parviboronicapiens TaxID=436516 RepID=UPI000D387A91|nr:hypothetical protein [Lysinibacillus parviboronicapiens]
MNIKKEKRELKKDESYDYYPEAARFTLTILLATLLIWGVLDSLKTENTGFGFQWWLIIEIVVIFIISRYYFIIMNSRKKENNKQ